jgi:hypothetical protein
VKRAEAALVAEDTEEAAYAAGGKSFTPKATSCSGGCRWRSVDEGFNPAVLGSGWPKTARAAWGLRPQGLLRVVGGVG